VTSLWPWHRLVVETVAAAQPKIEAELPADLGGLVMVATKAVSEVVVPQVEVPAGPRRRDVVRQAEEQHVAIELKQVETRNN
jgi:ribonuclease E